MVTSIWKQAALSSDWRGRFQQPQGWPASAKDAGLMFDNEIDWVTRLENAALSAVRRARAAQDFLNTFEYKAEHKQLSYANNSGKCSSKKSVFRSATRWRVSATSCSQADLYVG